MEKGDKVMKYEKGNIVTGKVTGIENYGIFISLDDEYTGLIHISEISEGYVRNVNDFAKIGESIKTRIIDIDNSNKHMKLSLKSAEIKNKICKYKSSISLSETGKGFQPLSENLNVWIEKRLNNIKNDKKTEKI